jgi:antitoxin VapB
MATAKVFMSGRSQAVRLPKEFRFDVDEVLIERTAEGVLLRTRTRMEKLESFLASRPYADEPFEILRDTRPPERDESFWRAMFGEESAERDSPRPSRKPTSKAARKK